MEDVLEVYHRPYEDNEVLVCLDETSKQSLPSATTGGEGNATAASASPRDCRVRLAPDRQSRMITNTSATG